MLEFAVVVPLILLLIGGSIDWGMTLFAKQIALNASRRVTRTLSVIKDFPDNTADPTYQNYYDQAETELLKNLPELAIFDDFQLVLEPISAFGSGTGLIAIKAWVVGNYKPRFLSLFSFNNLRIENYSLAFYERFTVPPQDYLDSLGDPGVQALTIGGGIYEEDPNAPLAKAPCDWSNTDPTETATQTIKIESDKVFTRYFKQK